MKAEVGYFSQIKSDFFFLFCVIRHQFVGVWKKKTHLFEFLHVEFAHQCVTLFFRLVELQHLPWSNHDVLKVIQNGRLKEHMERISMETIPRLSYLLQRALVRVGREVQRLACSLGMCSKQEVCSALRIILCPALADSCTKVRLKCDLLKLNSCGPRV